ncbi:glycoside hydrolase/phage tail family protein [Henriciella sp.]|uniref:baseplate multidomain protein megatron n=1 Tax=Henriciella sp. TaxID=1968823 RepID=UPI002621F9B4|nr:glycoside hydrolase/phage tail family protein [Henriciella sp.]
MGQIILSQVGSVAGSAALPNGINILGQQISGAAIGSALGGLAGRSIDAALTPAAEGPRIEALHLMESRDGAGMASVYGRARVGGQLIWASRFKERRHERSAGKGGPEIAEYSYSVSFAVAIAEGPVNRIDRVWANGEILALSDYNWRLYKGSKDQLPDPLIEAIEGAGHAPAYRGTAYIVFEDMPLDAFGNRLPQMSFEVVRASQRDDGLRQLAMGVNIIPASGEFVYGREIVRERRFPGIETPLNMNNAAGEADFVRSLDQLTSDLPAVESAALTVGWFGDDLRAGHCRVRPGVETRERATVPYGWEVAGRTRATAKLVSQSGESANYGGTPADRAVIEGIQAMKAEGIAVTLSPFLLMDVPPGNGLPDPYGGAEQAAFPWRGRMTSETDGTAAARSEIEAFLGADDDFGFRHFILHHARLGVEAGGVDAILIGSEMRGLSRVRDETGAFPFVEGLVQLAADVKAIVGPGTKVSYAADWTEYGAYVPGDGTGDVLFPLDMVWASPDVDFVGVDWYPPAGDWREGADHLDALAGYEAADAPAYLVSQMAGGEAYDWYYAAQADRDGQVRTPIIDTAHGEDWVFRPKDLAGWWTNAHHERPAGVRDVQPTGWASGMKPVRLMEIGFPALDKGGNAPNLFYDPKSSESALPPYSSGQRDDVYQRRALEVALSYWQGQPFIEQALIWAWDGRPWPDFPAREDVWSDGPNWAYGHWLNGRTGLIGVNEVIEDMAGRAGAGVADISVNGVLEGMVLRGSMPLRRALEPLRAMHGLTCLERADGLEFLGSQSRQFVSIDPDRIAEPGLSLTHELLDKQPGHLQLSHINADGGYAPATVDARSAQGDPGYSIKASVPLVLSEGVASGLADHMLAAALEPDSASITLPPEYIRVDAGDLVALEGQAGLWEVADITDDGLLRQLNLTRPAEGAHARTLGLPDTGEVAAPGAAPELVLIDGPALGAETGRGPWAAVSATPWTGPVTLRAGGAETAKRVRATLAAPCGIGTLTLPLSEGLPGRWDRANELNLEMKGADLASATEQAVLAGANRILVDGMNGWELLGFADAEITGPDRWRLGSLLRGLNGSQASAAEAGAICVVADERLVQGLLSMQEISLPLEWQAGHGEAQTFIHEDVAGLPWPVAHLQAVRHDDGFTVSWFPRGPDIPDNWDLPDPVRPRLFRVDAVQDGNLISTLVVGENTAEVPLGATQVRVAEIGTDGREGRRVSIVTGAS